MFSSLLVTYHLLWLLSRSLAIHALPGPIYYYISAQCQESGTFTSADADEALSFTKAAIRKDTENYENTLENIDLVRPPADVNQAFIFFWIYSAQINTTAFADVSDDREQMNRYQESSDRYTSTIRIECDNDRRITDHPPGRWQRVVDIPYSPDQNPNRPMQNSQRNQNTFAPGTVVEYTDVWNRMRANARSNFCYSNPAQMSVLHITPELYSNGQVEPRYVITICDSALNRPPVYQSMDGFFASPVSFRNQIMTQAPLNLFSRLKSLQFLYMLYQLPPLGKQATVTQFGVPVGLGGLARIFKLGPNASRNHAGAFAWYDLLAGFADRGWVFRNAAAVRITRILKTQVSTPEMVAQALQGPLIYDSSYVYPPDD